MVPTYLEAVGKNAHFTSGENGVLMALAWHADSEGHCSMSIAEITSWSGLSHMPIRRTIKVMLSAGCLTSEQRTGRPTVYRLDTEAISAYIPATLRGGTPTRSSTPQSSTPATLRGGLDTDSGNPLETTPATSGRGAEKIPLLSSSSLNAPESSLNTPDWYQDLLSFKRFAVSAEKAVAWVNKKNLDDDVMNQTVVDMRAALIWNEKRQRYEYVDREGKTRVYSDPWAVCQKWATRPRLSGANNAGATKPPLTRQQMSILEKQRYGETPLTEREERILDGRTS